MKNKPKLTEEEMVVGKIPKLPSFRGKVLRNTIWDDEYLNKLIRKSIKSIKLS